MTIRPSSIAVREACLEILAGNTPESFIREDLTLPDGYGPGFDRVTREIRLRGDVGPASPAGEPAATTRSQRNTGKTSGEVTRRADRRHPRYSNSTYGCRSAGDSHSIP